jgi:hypothetical protein
MAIVKVMSCMYILCSYAIPLVTCAYYPARGNLTDTCVLAACPRRPLRCRRSPARSHTSMITTVCTASFGVLRQSHSLRSGMLYVSSLARPLSKVSKPTW